MYACDITYNVRMFRKSYVCESLGKTNDSNKQDDRIGLDFKILLISFELLKK